MTTEEQKKMDDHILILAIATGRSFDETKYSVEKALKEYDS